MQSQASLVCFVQEETIFRLISPIWKTPRMIYFDELMAQKAQQVSYHNRKTKVKAVYSSFLSTGGMQFYFWPARFLQISGFTRLGLLLFSWREVRFISLASPPPPLPPPKKKVPDIFGHKTDMDIYSRSMESTTE